MRYSMRASMYVCPILIDASYFLQNHKIEKFYFYEVYGRGHMLIKKI